MKIREKINLDYHGLKEHGPITIVAFGDSVTHGAVASGEMDYESVYHHRLAKMIHGVRNYVPVNVINAGIGGITAKGLVVIDVIKEHTRCRWGGGGEVFEVFHYSYHRVYMIRFSYRILPSHELDKCFVHHNGLFVALFVGPTSF